MASVNKVILVGNLGRDPEVRYMPSGDAIANLSVATTDNWKDKSGEKQESTEWHRVVFFGKLAEVCGEYLKKGSSIYVEGSLRTRKYKDKDGQDKYITEIRGDRMQMLGGRAGASAADSEAAAGAAPRDKADTSTGGVPDRAAGSGFGGLPDDDIPFAIADFWADPMLRRRARRSV